MNKKYERYINYIINDIELPYFINMKEMYGLNDSEYKLILPKVFNQSVTIKDNNIVYDINGNIIYSEDSSDGEWIKYKYNTNGNEIYYEDSDGFWVKQEYDSNGNVIYYEDSDGVIIDNR